MSGLEMRRPTMPCVIATRDSSSGRNRKAIASAHASVSRRPRVSYSRYDSYFAEPKLCCGDASHRDIAKRLAALSHFEKVAPGNTSCPKTVFFGSPVVSLATASTGVFKKTPLSAVRHRHRWQADDPNCGGVLTRVHVALRRVALAASRAGSLAMPYAPLALGGDLPPRGRGTPWPQRAG